MLEDDKFKHDVFLSYKRGGEEGEIAGAVHDILEGAGFSVFMDVKYPEPGDFFDFLAHNLERSGVVVAVITPESLKSPFCNGELILGRAYTRIIPVAALGVEFKSLPWGLGDVEGARYGTVTQLATLVELVRQFRTSFPTRTSFKNLPLPVQQGSTVSLLQNLYKWPPQRLASVVPPRAMTSMEATRRMQEAARVMRPVAPQQMVAYDDPSSVGTALRDIANHLTSISPDRQVWKALAILAQPFIPQIQRYALDRMKANDREFEELVGIKRADADRDRGRRSVKIAVPRYSRKHRALVKAVLKEVAPPPAKPAAQIVAKETIAAPSPTNPPTPISAGSNSGPPLRLTSVVKESGAAPASPLAVRELEFPRVPVKGLIALLAFLVLSFVLAWPMIQSAKDREAPETLTPPNERPEPSTVAAAVPLPRLPYCQSDLECRFLKGASFARVTEECYGHGRWWELRDENISNPEFATRGPHDVWNGEPFKLPKACRPDLIRKYLAAQSMGGAD